MKHIFRVTLTTLAVLASLSSQAATVSTFDDLSLAPNSHFFPETSTTFTSGAATFGHNYESTYGSWSGWVYSSEHDQETEGYENQYSVFGNGGAGGSQNFALSYVASYEPASSAITFQAPVIVNSASFTNTTYAALSMLNGDPFAKKFGGATGNDPDYFYVSVIGKDAQGATTGSVNVYLADFRAADNSQDYVLDHWQAVDLSSLGAVSSLAFQMASSDTGSYGIKTPAYFALDNVSVTTAVPEASAVWMAMGGIGMLVALRRRRAA